MLKPILYTRSSTLLAHLPYINIDHPNISAHVSSLRRSNSNDLPIHKSQHLVNPLANPQQHEKYIPKDQLKPYIQETIQPLRPTIPAHYFIRPLSTIPNLSSHHPSIPPNNVVTIPQRRPLPLPLLHNHTTPHGSHHQYFFLHLNSICPTITSIDRVILKCTIQFPMIPISFRHSGAPEHLSI